MGRFETLKPETQDMVEAMLPAIAASFKIDVANFKDIIPENIRMRQWDCDRRDHIKDKPENEPRNWGVEFLKCLQAIARLNGGNLPLLQERIYENVEKHAEKHPWARLEDIRIVKAEFQNPSLRDPTAPEPESSSDDSLDSYLEELVDRNPGRGIRSGRNEDYESRVQGWWKPVKAKKPKKPVRLRRDEDGGYKRCGKDKNKRKNPDTSALQEGSSSPDAVRDNSPPREPKRRRLVSKRSLNSEKSLRVTDEDPNDSDDPDALINLAELEAAEAELEFMRKEQRVRQLRIDAEQAKAARAASASSAGRSNSTLQGFTDGYGSRELSGFAMDNGESGFSNLSGFNDRTGFNGFSDFGEPSNTMPFHGFNDSEAYDRLEDLIGLPSPSIQSDHPVSQEFENLAPVEQDDDEEYEESHGETDSEDEEDEEDDREEENEEDFDDYED